MADYDFLTNVETAFLKIFAANAVLDAYNWQRWDSDVELKLPRGVLGLRARIDPEETPYRRVEVAIRLEGRPKRHKLSVVMHEMWSVLQSTNASDLSDASDGTVKFIGDGVAVSEDRPIASGLRTWTIGFSIYALPMVA